MPKRESSKDIKRETVSREKSSGKDDKKRETTKEREKRREKRSASGEFEIPTINGNFPDEQKKGDFN